MLCDGNAEMQHILYKLGGKSFGFVGIDIECKDISISGDIGGSYCLPNSLNSGN